MRSPRLFGWGTESFNSGLFDENEPPFGNGCWNNRDSILPMRSPTECLAEEASYCCYQWR